jgi:hypothetical protein
MGRQRNKRESSRTRVGEKVCRRKRASDIGGDERFETAVWLPEPKAECLGKEEKRNEREKSRTWQARRGKAKRANMDASREERGLGQRRERMSC